MITVVNEITVRQHNEEVVAEYVKNATTLDIVDDFFIDELRRLGFSKELNGKEFRFIQHRLMGNASYELTSKIEKDDLWQFTYVSTACEVEHSIEISCNPNSKIYMFDGFVLNSMSIKAYSVDKGTDDSAYEGA